MGLAIKGSAVHRRAVVVFLLLAALAAPPAALGGARSAAAGSPTAAAGSPTTTARSAAAGSAGAVGGSPTAVAVSPTAIAVSDAARYPKMERYAFHLVNCMRTGGRVLRDGTCKGYGSGRYSSYRRPLRYAPAISDRVSRPYAVKMAKAKACRHDLGTANGGVRLRRAGFDGDWGENIGCSSGTTREMILRVHLMYQSEKGTSGWHWRNIKRRDLKKVGIGVARVDGVPRLVEDFFQP